MGPAGDADPVGSGGTTPRHDREPGELVHAEPVMGTVASFRVHLGGVTAAGAAASIAEACRLLHDADRVFSTWKPESPLSRYRRGELALDDAPAELAVVQELCASVKAQSQGWFDPWSMPGGFDPTGLVKGWAVERALRVVERAGVAGAVVNAGGDIAVAGEPAPGEPWTFAVRHPHHADAAACIVRVRSAIATSGVYERGAHLVDPWTGHPACRVASATVTGPSLAIADALATALAVAGEPGLAIVAGDEGYEGFIVRADGTGVGTRGFAPLIL